MAASDVENLAEALKTGKFAVDRARRIGGKEVLVGRRSDFKWSWLASRLHTFVVAFEENELTTQRAEELTAAAQQFAIDHKGGLPRGLQTGTATLATFLSPSPAPEAIDWFKHQPHHRYAALRLPILADLNTRKLAWFSDPMTRGYIYQQHLHQVVREIIAPGLRSVS